MDATVVTALLVFVQTGFVRSVLVPTPNRHDDIASLVYHIKLVTSLVTSLQNDVITSQDELKITKQQLTIIASDLTATKGELNTTKQELTLIESDLTATKNELKSAETEIIVLKTEIKLRPNAGQLTPMKAEIESLKAVLDQINTTVVDGILADVNLNKKELGVMKSDVMNNALRIETTRMKGDTNTMEQAKLQRQLVDVGTQLNTTIFGMQAMEGYIDDNCNVTSLTRSLETILERNFTSVTQSLESQIHNNMIDRLSSLENKLTQRIKRDTAIVAFQVSQKTSLSKKQWKSSLLKFGVVDYNYGNGYRKTTGQFTASIPGIYMFWANIVMHTAGGRVYITNNSRRLAAGYARITNGNTNLLYNTASATVVVHLVKGDRIQFAITPVSLVTGEFKVSYYGGVLLRSDAS